MNLKKIIFNTEKRFKTAESNGFKEYSLNYLGLVGRSVLRGGIIGGTIGYLAGGDVGSVNVGAALGVGVDYTQSTWRLINLISWHRDKKKIKEYEDHKDFYRKKGIL